MQSLHRVISSSAYIEATGSNVSANQNAMLRVAKFEKCIGTLLLLLFAVEIQHGAVNVVEKLGIVLDRGTAAEEYNDLLLLGLHSSQEGEEQNESLVGVTENIALFQSINCAKLLFFVDVDV